MVSTVGGAVGSGLATGGQVRGPGTSTSDSIPAWLSDGEFVMRAKAVKKYGLPKMHAMNALRLADGGEAKYKADWADFNLPTERTAWKAVDADQQAKRRDRSAWMERAHERWRWRAQMVTSR